ncbi:hypothetical protein QFC19_006649 [Naganishia cerealis]|uniref:Uncharacterized protein n=1 Tax=Naganishia cerealis TaxID=610337 RepID=A0ACC2VG05_9TREE|nr:hypothetical protein QFC19_006649 [Naganishia cerealis]
MATTYPPPQPDAPSSATLGSSLTSLTNQPSTLRYAPGVQLTPTQQHHVCLVLDLFQAKGTWAKIEKGLAEDAVYEDLFATAKNRVEVENLITILALHRDTAGQFLGLPIVTTKSETISHEITAVKPVSGAQVHNPSPPSITSTPSTSTEPATLSPSSASSQKVSEIDIKVHHRFTFKPLGNAVNMHSTLVVFSDEESGKIVRIQDRPMEEIPDNSLITMLRKMNAVVAPKLLGIPPASGKEDHNKFQSRHA